MIRCSAKKNTCYLPFYGIPNMTIGGVAKLSDERMVKDPPANLGGFGVFNAIVRHPISQPARYRTQVASVLRFLSIQG